MFTANSMNCLAEVLGLSLPGNGTTLATHAFRKELFLEAGHKIVELAKRYYEEEDEAVLPRSIATKAAFSNAMAMDVAMGGSTNTILHILAVAIEAGVDFGLDDIDRISRVVPTLSKVAPNGTAHVEDVHRAGGIPAILGELDRAGLLDHTVHSVHSPDLASWLAEWDIRSGTASKKALALFRAAPGGVRTTEAFSTTNTWDELDTDGEEGVVRALPHAHTKDGGLAVLTGNLAEDGAVFKTAGVTEDLFHVEGTAGVCDCQGEAGQKSLGKPVKAGDVARSRRERARGGVGGSGAGGPARTRQGRWPAGPHGQSRRGRRRGQDSGRDRGPVPLRGHGRGVRLPGGGGPEDPGQDRQGRRRGGDPLRGPTGRAGHAGDALPHVLPQGEGPRQDLRADHRRPLLGRHERRVHRAHLPGSRRRRAYRPDRGR